jgi:hypothetical protein
MNVVVLGMGISHVVMALETQWKARPSMTSDGAANIELNNQL